MPNFSVKKPLTVFVAVIAALVLGVVAYFKMTPDLLPNMDFPYVMIMTTYPGANPEQVEKEVTQNQDCNHCNKNCKRFFYTELRHNTLPDLPLLWHFITA